MVEGASYNPKHLKSLTPSGGGRRRRVFAVVGIVMMLLLIAPAVVVLFTNVFDGDSSPTTTTPSASPPTPTAPEGPPPHQVARTSAAEIEVFDQPADAEPQRVVARSELSGVEDHPIVFLVERVAEVPGWLEVHLPIPVGETSGEDEPAPRASSTGFVRASDVEVVEHRHRIEVDRSAQELRIFEGDTLIAVQPVVTACADRIPADAVYFIKESVHFSDPEQTYQAFVLGLSGFPSMQQSLDAGDAVVGIQGISGSLSDGQAGTDACIRLSDEVIGQLITFDPLGSPVEILDAGPNEGPGPVDG